MTYTDFLAAWREGTDPELAALKAGGVKAIRAKTGLSQRAFAERYGIPHKTLKNWESDSPTARRTAPEYVIALLAYAAQQSHK